MIVPSDFSTSKVSFSPVSSKTQEEKLLNADKMAVQRLASGVLPELDACFEALQLA